MNTVLCTVSSLIRRGSKDVSVEVSFPKLLVWEDFFSKRSIQTKSTEQGSAVVAELSTYTHTDPTESRHVFALFFFRDPSTETEHAKEESR